MKRVPRWAKRHPIMVNLIIVMFVFSVGFWRVEHLYSCAQDYAEATTAANKPIREAAARVDAADDRAWSAIDELLRQQGDPADIRELKRAVNRRDTLTEELQQAREENPVPEPPGTFC